MPLPPIICVRESATFAGHQEYVEVVPDEHRIIRAVVVKDDPLRYIPMSMMYVDVGPGHIRTQLRPHSPEQDDFYRIEQTTICWSHRVPDEEFSWTLITSGNLPDWYPAFREKARKRMDERWAGVTMVKPGLKDNTGTEGG